MSHEVKILKIQKLTPDTRSYQVEKPADYSFIPGQATEVAINKKGLENKKRPFTFTSLNSSKYLEFIIKSYFDHNGITKKLFNLSVGDGLVIDQPWGSIKYKGPGIFIAGGAGVTPFLAILRQLQLDNQLQDNRLILSNKTSTDIILEKELKQMFISSPKNLLLTLTNEKNSNYLNEFINQNFLKKYINNFKQNFYLCGPPAMVKELKKILLNLEAQPTTLVFEK